MTTVRLWADPDVASGRATRQSDFVNTIWRGLANDPGPEFL